MMYKYLFRPVLFLFSPETAHYLVTFILKILHPVFGNFIRLVYFVRNENLKRKVFGIEFPNPVGLAAGFDKDAKYVNELSDFGFGFIEIGTVTPLPQSGNPKPRLFRLKKDKALINRMGFNNEGAMAAAARLKKRNKKIIIGGNIGKNKNTPNENAVDDYEKCFHALFDDVNYFVINVSSPNTPDLRALQEKEPLKKILSHLIKLRNAKVKTGEVKPILLKIAPDLSNEQLDEIVEIVLETKTDGIVATNTTLYKDNLRTPNSELQIIGNGGLSGKSFSKRVTEIIKYLCKISENKIPIIGVGGVHSSEDAIEKLNAGAALVQVYTGFIYEGPSLVKKINSKIAG